MKQTYSLFDGITFYVEPIQFGSSKDSTAPKFSSRLKDLIHDYGGRIAPSPLSPNVKHIIITSFKKPNKNEISHITLSRQRSDSSSDRYGWWCYTLIERFGGMVNSSGKEDWNGEKVVLNERWLWDCIQYNKVLGRREEWGGWRIRGTYRGKDYDKSFKPLSSPLQSFVPSRSLSEQSTPVTTPIQKSSPSLPQTEAFTNIDYCSTNNSERPYKIPCVTWATQIGENYLPIDPAAQQESKTMFDTDGLMTLPPDPRLPYKRQTSSFEGEDKPLDPRLLLRKMNQQQKFENTLQDSTCNRHYCSPTLTSKLQEDYTDPKLSPKPVSNTQLNTHLKAETLPSGPSSKLADPTKANDTLNIICRYGTDGEREIKGAIPMMENDMVKESSIRQMNIEGILESSGEDVDQIRFPPTPKIMKEEAGEHYNDSDLDCLNSDDEEEELDNQIEDKIGITADRDLNMSSNPGKLDILKKYNLTLLPLSDTQQQTKYEEPELKLPPTPISAFPPVLANSQAFPLPTSKLSDEQLIGVPQIPKKRPRSVSVISSRSSSSIVELSGPPSRHQKKAKPTGEEACRILAKKFAKYPKLSNQALFRLLEEQYEGRQWQGWKTFHRMHRHDIEKIWYER